MATDNSAPRAPESITETYFEDVPNDIGAFREILEKYSNIPPEKVDEHLRQIRDKAWAVRPYPCIGRWSFTNLMGLQHPAFQALVKRLKQPDSQDAFLDVACCVGQVLRKLVFEGVDPARLYATDLVPEFLDLGFELFNDREKFGSDTFIAANMLDPNDEGLKKLDGKVTIIHVANFFHLFDRDQQVSAATRMIKFLKPGVKDAVIIGGNIGSLKPDTFTARNGTARFLHDPKTFQEMWDEAGRKTGTKWKAASALISTMKIQFPGWPDESRYLGWVVRQVDETVSS